MVREYEALYIINPTLEDEEIKNVVEKFKNVVETQAQLKNVDEWGKRKLAYPVNKLNEGYYVFMEFGAEPDFPQELERIFKITDSVMKYLIVRKDREV
jgi:small subunit ribosomal protein S6